MREIFYIKSNFEEHKFIYTGLEFYEFMRAVRKPIENIILLEGNYLSEHYIHCFEVLKGKEEIQELLKENVNKYGNFCFVDCKPETVELLSSQEIAELLYLSHMFKPMKSPFFNTIENNYVYLAHDDGYFGQLYCKYLVDFSEIIESKIEWCIKNKVNNYESIDKKTKSHLLELTKEGLLIDLHSLKYSNNRILINLFLLENKKLDSMDDLYNYYEDIVYRCPWKGVLQFEKGRWFIRRV